MKTPNTIEQEINRIRLAIYEETKDMTPKQRAEYYTQSAETGVKKLGFQFVTTPDNKRFLVKIQPGQGMV